MALTNRLSTFQEDMLKAASSSKTLADIVSAQSSLMNDTIRGAKATGIWVDDLWNDCIGVKIDQNLIITFEDAQFPGFKVQVRREAMAPNDPRNPNPKAPPSQVFHIHVGEHRTPKGYSNETIAVKMAEEAFHAVIAKARSREAEVLAAIPNFGRF